MEKFEILCVTTKQNDFSKINEMNIHSNVIFANQANITSYTEKDFDGHKAKMITTATRGVGINRNLALMYASAEYCLFADDDCKYIDDVEAVVIQEFEQHPEADVFIFHLRSNDPVRSLRAYSKTQKYNSFMRRPWGGARIAFKLSSVKKANIWFNTLFGGGCIFPSGEDSMWINEALRKGLCFYVSDKTIGELSFDDSSWFTGVNEKYYFAKGAHFASEHRYTFFIWTIYFSMRTQKLSKMRFSEKVKWMYIGKACFRNMTGYEEYMKSRNDNA